MATPVSDIMTTPVLTVDPGTALDEIAAAMLEEEIRSIAVIDDGCSPDGILTSTDFMAVVADGASERTVGDCMTREVVTVDPELSVTAAAAEMVEHGVSHLPVVGEDGVVGIVTATDVADHVGSR